MNETSYDVFSVEERPGKFLMLRNVDGIPTHHLDAYGQWIGLPWDRETAQTTLEYFLNEGELPQWAIDPTEFSEKSLES